jgi:hypothetical protein
MLWIVAAIWLMGIVRSVIIGTTLIATATASQSTTTSLGLLVLRLWLRVSVLRMLLLLVWRIARRRRWRWRVVVLLGASHRRARAMQQAHLVEWRASWEAITALLLQEVAFRCAMSVN